MRPRTSRHVAAVIIAAATVSCEPGTRFLGPALGSPSVSSAAVSGTLEVWVRANPTGQAATLITRLLPESLRVDYGATVILEARLANAAGRSIPSSITYVSGNSNVVTAMSTGEVRGIGYGQTTVTVSSGTVSRVIPVSVGAIPLGGLSASGPRANGVAISSVGVVYAVRGQTGQSSTLVRSNLPSIAFADASVTIGPDAQDVVFNSTGTKAYVAYGVPDGGAPVGIGVFDVATNAEVARVPLPGPSIRVAISPDDQKVYAISVPSTDLSVINATTNTIVNTIPLTGQPNAFAWAPDGSRLYVLTGDLPGSTGHFGAIAEINPVTDTPVRTFQVGGQSLAIAVSLDGTRLYVAKYAPKSLEAWNLATGLGIASVALPDTGYDMHLTLDGTKIWAPLYGQGKVLVFDSQSLHLLASIRTHGNAYRIAWDPRGSTAAISNGLVAFAQTGPFASPEGDPRLRVGVSVGDTAVGTNGVAAWTVVIPSGILLDQQASVRLNANLVNPAGWVFTSPATYSTTTPQVVQVNSSGVVTGLRGGVGSVTATIGTQSTTLPVTVHGHPTPVLSATTTLPDRAFGTAVSTQGVFYATRFDANLVARGTLPGTAIESNIAVGSVPTSVAFNSAGTTAYVTNQASSTLSVIDVATGAQLASLRLEGSTSPTGHGRSTASPPATDSALSAVSSRRLEAVDAGPLATPVPLNGSPFGVTVSPDDAKVYVGIVSSNTVQVVDPSVPQVVRTITLGGSGPTYFAWSPDGTRLYVNSTTSGVITELDAATDVVTRTFSTGGRPQGMAVSRDGSELYVSDENRQMLDVWQLSNLTRIASTPLGASGLELQLSPDNARIWVSLKTQGKVLVIDRATRQVLQSVTTGGRPRQIAFDLFGTTGVVGNDQANALHFIR